MRPIDKTTARYHADLSEERYHVDGRSKRLTKRFAKRKSGCVWERAGVLRCRRIDRRSLGCSIKVRGRAGPSGKARQARGAWRTRCTGTRATSNAAGRRRSAQPFVGQWVAVPGPVAVVAPPGRSAATTPASSRLGHRPGRTQRGSRGFMKPVLGTQH